MTAQRSLYRLVYNLETVLAEIGHRRVPVSFSLHPGMASLRGRNSEITRLLDRAPARI
jgi:hypothetical protein